MRLPWFDYRAPATLAEAARILAGEGASAAILAGGTDLLANMKRRQQTPRTLVALRRIAELRELGVDANGVRLGSAVTLARLATDAAIRTDHCALAQAAAQVATPHLRAMGTLGGNLCLDTRCSYYNQTEEWRRAIGYCMKRDGETCWVATASRRCLAVSSTDTAPALIALGARVRLVSREGEREIALAELYRNDGIDYLTRRPDEILAEVWLPRCMGWKSTYWKLRRRGSFDFPLLGVAAAVRTAADGTVLDARLVLGAVSSHPLGVDTAALVGRRLDDDAIAELAERAESRAKPMDNADMEYRWRKEVVADFVGFALRELRGEDLRAERLRYARYLP